MATRRNFIKHASFASAALLAAPSCLAFEFSEVEPKKEDENPSADDRNKLHLRKNDVILFYGDSITDGNHDRESGVPSKPNTMGGGYVLSVTSTLYCNYPNMGFKFWNRGINGNKTFQMIDRLETDCLGLKYKPTVVSLLTGVNDCALAVSKQGKPDPETYEKDLRELLTRITEGLPGVRLIMMEPYIVTGIREKIDGFAPGFYDYQPIARKLAEEFGAVFVPLQDKFNDAAERYGRTVFTTDGVHPFSGGVEMMARAWLDAVVVDEE